MSPDRYADAVPHDGRDETQNERMDRNWNELLQELRVTQTGTQILSGFLLTLVFQPRFASLDALQRGLYVALVILAADRVPSSARGWPREKGLPVRLRRRAPERGSAPLTRS